MLQMSILLAYIFYFVAASASPLQRRWLAVNRDGGGQIDFAFRVMLIVATCGFGLIFFFPPELKGNPVHLALLFAACGVFGASHFVSNYSAQKHVDAGVSTLLSNIYTPVTIILATLFLHEGLKPLQVAGTVLLLAAMVIVSKKHHLGNFKFDKYFWLMVTSGIALGVALGAERALMKTTGFTTGTLMSWWSQAIGLGIATIVTKNKTTYKFSDIGVTGGLKFLQGLSWVLLLKVVNNLSVAASVTTFKIVVVFAAAAIFLNEREDIKRKILGSLVAIVGLLLMK